MATNRISLNIAGLNILVSTSEDEEYVKQIAKEIDDSINVIVQGSTGASVTSAVLLCAIDYLDSYKKANRTANNMRSQIKEYLSEAANAKLEFDEERKRNDELNVEMQALRNHLTRIATEGDNSGIVKKMRDDYTALGAELEKLRKKNTDLTSQNKSLSEKNEAMNTYIAGQDREIARLSAVSEELNTRLIDKTNVISELSDRLSGYESQVSDLMSETNRLRSELELLEEMIHEEKAYHDKEEQRKQEAKKKDFMVNINDLYEQKPHTDVAPKPEKTEAAAVQESVPQRKPEPQPEPPKTLAEAVAALYDGGDGPEEPKKEIKRKNDKSDIYADIEAVIQQVNEKPDRPSGKSMKDFDIDISDLPNIEKAGDAFASDSFDDFHINDDDTVLGFGSSQHETRKVPTENAPETKTSDDAAPWEENEDTPRAELKNNETAFIGDIIDARADDTFTIPAPDLGDAPENNETDIIETLSDNEEDDAMPNLSWTLDV